MKLSVIIINFNTAEMTEKAIKAFQNSEAHFDYEIILIDNASTKKLTPEKINEFGLVYLENEKNIGFAPAVNRGLKIAKGEYVLLLNSDVLVGRDSAEKMLEYMDQNANIAVLGPKLVYPSGQTQASAGYFPNLWREILRFSMLNKIFPAGTLIYKNIFNKKFFSRPQIVDWVSGGCMMLRQHAIFELGIFDNNYFFGIEDWDFCHRAKKSGWQVVYYPFARVVHYHGFSSGGRRSTASLRMEKEGVKYFLKKFYPKKKISNNIIELMYNCKIRILDLLGF
jgi:hypothetical protein